MKKNFQVKLTARAQSDVERTRAYIAHDKPAAADKWVRTVLRKAGSLSSFPLRCEVIPEQDGFEQEYRHLIFGNYRIVFRVADDTVIVIRILHAARILKPGYLSD